MISSRRHAWVLRTLNLFLLLPFFILSSCEENENVFFVPADTEDQYEIHFIDVGQGDAIFISTPDKNLLVDGGRHDSNITDYLLSLDIEKIDFVIATHPHADHIAGLINVFYDFDIGEVLDPGVVHTTYTFNQYLSTIEVYDIPFTIGRKGMERVLSEHAFFKLLHPVNPSDDHLNNASIVAHVTLGEVTVLLTGDLEKEGEAEVLQEPHLLASDILKVGHHGSNTSSTMPFLEAVDPDVSVIQCGQDNPYGHPHGPVLERLAAIGTDVYRTDIHGHIVIETDGEEYTVHTE